jgi:hypothetical protein
VHVIDGEEGEVAVAVVLAFGPHRPPGAGREREVEVHAGLDAGLLIHAEHVLAAAERPSFPFPLVRVKDAPGLEGEARVAEEDARPVLPGLDGVIGEPAVHVDGEIARVIPLATTWRASSRQVQRAAASRWQLASRRPAP